jgi:hypothetical protein
VAQVTAKTAREVLDWIETNQHHIGDAQTPGFFVLKGYQNTLRIPTTLYADMADLIEPGGEFDTRMFRAKQVGSELLSEAQLAYRAGLKRGMGFCLTSVERVAEMYEAEDLEQVRMSTQPLKAMGGS